MFSFEKFVRRHLSGFAIGAFFLYDPRTSPRVSSVLHGRSGFAGVGRLVLYCLTIMLGRVVQLLVTFGTKQLLSLCTAGSGRDQ